VGTKIWRRNADGFPHTPHTSLSGGARSLRLDPSMQPSSQCITICIHITLYCL